MALFNGTKWEKLASSNIDGQVLTVDTTAATGWKVAAAASGGTLNQTYNNGAAPADETMSIEPTRGPVKILDTTEDGTELFRVIYSDGIFNFIKVDSASNYGIKLLDDGTNSSLALGADALFNTSIHFTFDNVFSIGSLFQQAAAVFTRIVSAGGNTLNLIGGNDQINLSLTGFDPNVDIQPTLGTITKRFLSFAVKSGTVFYDSMLTSTNFGRGELLRGRNLANGVPGVGIIEYSPLLEFQQTFGNLLDPESGYGSTRWAMQGRINATTFYSNDRIVFLENPTALLLGDYSASPEYVAISRYGVKAREFVSNSAAPTAAAGANALLGVLSAVSVAGTNDSGIVSFTTGTVGAGPLAGNTAATAEILKITFSDNFAGSCTVEWFPMGTDSNVGGQNTALVFNNNTNNNSRWGVCSTTGSVGNFPGGCSLYWNSPTAGGWTSTTAYKLGYKVSCF
jgi:hypothetical protein